MCAKHYENPTMLSKVTAKNVGNVFLDTLYNDIMLSQWKHLDIAAVGCLAGRISLDVKHQNQTSAFSDDRYSRPAVYSSKAII